MNIIRKIKLSSSDIEQIRSELDGYIWVIFDAQRGVMSAGDEYVMSMRDALMVAHRSHPSDIYGIGLDLETGEYRDILSINRLNKNTKNGEASEAKRHRIDDLVCYFFENLPAYEVADTTKKHGKDAYIRSLRES